MKSLYTISALVFFCSTISVIAFSPKSVDASDRFSNNKEFQSDSLLVKYKDNSKIHVKYIDTGLRSAAITSQEYPDQTRLLEETAQALLADTSVEYVQPNYIYHFADWTVSDIEATPPQFDDDLYWYYERSDLPSLWKAQGCPDAAACGGNKDIIVAVIDSGVAFEDFNDTAGLTGANFTGSPVYKTINLFTNENEIENNGLDDDCNGYVDDAHGIDVYAKSLLTEDTCTATNKPKILASKYKKAGHPVDTYGHGTYVTGLIASELENTESVSPAANISIMPISANEHFKDFFSTLGLVNAIDYAIENGVDVINLSLSGGTEDAFFGSAIERAIQNDIIVVAAAGNSNSTETGYPATIENVITVGAANFDGTKSSYSNYGFYIDVVAHVGSGGTSQYKSVYQQSLVCFDSCDVSSVDNGFSYQNRIGTSFATPQVSALAALIKSKNKELTHTQVETIMKETSSNDVFDPKTGYGVINFADAIESVPGSFAEELQVHQFWNNLTRNYLYTTSEVEKYEIINNPLLNGVFVYSDIAFRTFADIAEDTIPVYRFFNTQTGVHFYTVHEGEKNDVLKNLPQFSYEGIKFYVFSSQMIGSIPVHRFYNLTSFQHTYTSDPIRVDVLMSSGMFRYEGIKFYVLPAK